MNKTILAGKHLDQVLSYFAFNQRQMETLLFKVLGFVSIGLITISFLTLIAQTAIILNSKEFKYINIRHLAIKWLICLLLFQIQKVESRSGYNQLILEIAINLVLLWFAYPSTFFAKIHLKYFSSSHESAEENPSEDNFLNKLLSNIAIICLGIAKVLTVFIPPANRKSIEEVLKQTNSIIRNQSSFWSIFNDKPETQRTIYVKEDSEYQEELTFPSDISIPISRTGRVEEKPGIKAKGEEVEMFVSQITSKVSYKIESPVEICYEVETSKFTIKNMDNYKIDRYLLEQMCPKTSKIMEFIVMKDEIGFLCQKLIKFPSVRELDCFYEAIQEAEKKIQ